MSESPGAAPFKSWLTARLRQGKRDKIDEMAKRLIEDHRIPTRGSLGLYRAHLRASGYSPEEKATFEQAWLEMSQS